MSYSSIETALLTLLRSVSGMSSANCVAGDESILDKGIASGIIIDAGRGPLIAEGDTAVREITWEYIINLYIRNTSRKAAHDSLVALRSLVAAKLLQYPTLGAASVLRTSLQGDQPPTDVQMTVNDQAAGPGFRAQPLTLTVTEISSISGGQL